MNNLNTRELMQTLRHMSACHDADGWLQDKEHTLKSALEELPLTEWAIWLHKQCRKPDARQLGIPQDWIDAVAEMDAAIQSADAVLRASYLDNNRSKNFKGYNAARTNMLYEWHRKLRMYLISTIVD